MSLCEGVLGPVLDRVRSQYGWRCYVDGDPAVAIVDTGRATATSEPVSLYVREMGAGTLILSDRGETLSRLADEGFSLDDPVHSALWDEAMYTYRVNLLDDRVFVQTSLDRASSDFARFGDALVALDALRLVALPPSVRSRGLADDVEDYLKSQFTAAKVDRKPLVRLRHGVTIQPALRVNTDRAVLVQPGSASSRTQSYDHAHTLFSLAGRGGVPMSERLVVLGGDVREWDNARLRLLADEAYVGFWSYRGPIDEFLSGSLPDDPLMTPPEIEIPLLPA